MTKKRYEELLHVEHPFQLNSNQSNHILLLAMAAFGTDVEVPFCQKLYAARCINPSKKDPRQEIIEALITPKEMLAMDAILFHLKLNNSKILPTLEDLPAKCSAFLHEFHPDSMQARGQK